MRSSPLLLKEYFTTHLSFSARPDFDVTKLPSEGISPNDLDVDIKESSAEDAPRQRGCQIFISLKNEAQSKFPYDFSIALVGAFEIISEWPEGQVDSLFSANAPAVLYSAAREALALMTGQGPYNKVILPSVTFVKSPSGQSSTEGAPPASNQEKMAEMETKPIAKKRVRKTAARKNLTD